MEGWNKHVYELMKFTVRISANCEHFGQQCSGIYRSMKCCVGLYFPCYKMVFGVKILIWTTMAITLTNVGLQALVAHPGGLGLYNYPWQY